MPDPLHILLVLPGGGQGGGATLVFQLIEAFSPSGEFRISLITEPGSYAESRAKSTGIGVYTVPMMHSRFSRDSVQQLRSLFAQLTPDIIHAHGSRAGFYCARAGASDVAFFMYAVHGYQFVTKPLWLKLPAIWCERFVHRKAHTVTNDGYQEFNLAIKKKLIPAGTPHYTLPLGVSPTIPILNDPQRYKNKHIAFLGRLSGEKRPEFCLEIFRYLHPHGYRLTFIGGGRLQSAIESIIAENQWQDKVHCTGILPHEEAVRQLQDKSLLLLPSKAEGLGLAVLEGYAYGMPAIGARVHGIDEVIRDGVTGYTMQEQNPEAYARAVMQLHDDPERYQRFVAAGQAMLKTYSYENYVALHRRLYTERRIESAA